MKHLSDDLTAWPVILAAALTAVLFIGYGIGYLMLKRKAEEGRSPGFLLGLRQLVVPMFLVLLLLIGKSYIAALPVSDAWKTMLQHIASILLIVAGSGVVMRVITVAENMILERFSMQSEDNLRARKVHTQLRVIRRILNFFLVVIAFSAILMTFEGASEFGKGLLASAGIAGIVLGFAAQRTLGNVIAGVQIALTQPIRLDDAVVVEGEWGWIEEITLTYVVIRIWDLRRLVVPITYFVEKPFQNWTRTSSEILGSVVLYTDYSLPVAEMEEAFFALLEKSPLWDRKTKVLQVVEASEKTMTIRCLMTARNSPSAWDLRCHVRRGLIEWLQASHPEALPRSRVSVEDMPKTVMEKAA